MNKLAEVMKMAIHDLQIPPTEIEIAEVTSVLMTIAPQTAGKVVRRLAHQRDTLQAHVEQLQARNELLRNSLSFMTTAVDPAQSEETADWEITDVRWRLRIDELKVKVERLQAIMDEELRLVAFLSRPDIHVSRGVGLQVLVYDENWRFDARGENVISAARMAMHMERKMKAAEAGDE